VFGVVEKKKTGEMFAAKIEKATKGQKNPMLFWESKLIHKLKKKSKQDTDVKFHGKISGLTDDNVQAAYRFFTTSALTTRSRT